MSTELEPTESLRAGDIRFPYQRAGHGGLPIILLHGWPQTLHAWVSDADIEHYARALQRRAQVLLQLLPDAADRPPR